MEIHVFPVIDTGIGIAAGYASDREFIEASEAERALLPKPFLKILEATDMLMDEIFLLGKGEDVPLPTLR